MTTETQKVDVLAVLDRQIEQTRCFGGSPSYITLGEVRDAVAELIGVVTALSDFCAGRPMDPTNEEMLEQLSNHWSRVDQALARVGGAP